MNRRIYAVILCAGSGTRIKSEKNKIFMDIAGKSVFQRVTGIFNTFEEIDELIFVSKKDERNTIRSEAKKLNLSKPWHVVTGGSDRQSSVENAIDFLGDAGAGDGDLILIHDGARPLVKKDTVCDVIYALANGEKAVCTCVPAKDTLKIVNKEKTVESTPDRNLYMSVQTPQGFQFKIIRDALKKAKIDGFTGTDDASAVENAGISVRVIAGSYDNIKITTIEDLEYAEFIIGRKGGDVT